MSSPISLFSIDWSKWPWNGQLDRLGAILPRLADVISIYPESLEKPSAQYQWKTIFILFNIAWFVSGTEPASLWQTNSGDSTFQTETRLKWLPSKERNCSETKTIFPKTKTESCFASLTPSKNDATIRIILFLLFFEWMYLRVCAFMTRETQWTLYYIKYVIKWATSSPSLRALSYYHQCWTNIWSGK